MGAIFYRLGCWFKILKDKSLEIFQSFHAFKVWVTLYFILVI